MANRHLTQGESERATDREEDDFEAEKSKIGSLPLLTLRRAVSKRGENLVQLEHHARFTRHTARARKRLTEPRLHTSVPSDASECAAHWSPGMAPLAQSRAWSASLAQPPPTPPSSANMHAIARWMAAVVQSGTAFGY